MSFVELTGHAKLDRRTKDLVKRLCADDVAIIDHTDLDRVSAEELAGVGMGDGEFVAELRTRDLGQTGADEVAFLIRPNAGLPLAPVTETASGGELSRIALAIAAVGGGETMVFDEIDAGIGGETAHRVAETLQRLAQRAQVVTIAWTVRAA